MRTKRAWFLLALLCFAIYGAAFAARNILLPHTRADAFAIEPQPLWAQLSFLLLAIEMISSLGGAFLLIVALGALLGTRTNPHWP